MFIVLFIQLSLLHHKILYESGLDFQCPPASSMKETCTVYECLALHNVHIASFWIRIKQLSLHLNIDLFTLVPETSTWTGMMRDFDLLS